MIQFQCWHSLSQFIKFSKLYSQCSPSSSLRGRTDRATSLCLVWTSVQLNTDREVIQGNSVGHIRILFVGKRAIVVRCRGLHPWKLLPTLMADSLLINWEDQQEDIIIITSFLLFPNISLKWKHADTIMMCDALRW